MQYSSGDDEVARIGGKCLQLYVKVKPSRCTFKCVETREWFCHISGLPRLASEEPKRVGGGYGTLQFNGSLCGRVPSSSLRF
jgi:hypothetical protein